MPPQCLSTVDYCRGTAVFHLFLAILMAALMFSTSKGLGPKHLTTQTGVWVPIDAVPSDVAFASSNAVSSNTTLFSLNCSAPKSNAAYKPEFQITQVVVGTDYVVDIRAAIVVFHFLSFGAQLAASWDAEAYENMLNTGAPHLDHFFEYSVSAPLMLLALGVQFGITDLYLLMSICINCAACMIFGVASELLIETRMDVDLLKQVWPRGLPAYLVTEFAGWVCMVFALAPLLATVVSADACMSGGDVSMPRWVYGLMAFETVAFTSFGFVHLVSLWLRTQTTFDKAWVARRTEEAYITLSLLAKGLLGIIIFAGTFAGAR